jgi:hypothetical protein
MKFLQLVIGTVAIGLILSNEPALGLACLIGLYIYQNNQTTDDLNEMIMEKFIDIGSPDIVAEEPNLILVLWDINQLCGNESNLIFQEIVKKCQEYVIADSTTKHHVQKSIKREMGNLGLIAWNQKRRKQLDNLIQEMENVLANGININNNKRNFW